MIKCVDWHIFFIEYKGIIIIIILVYLALGYMTKCNNGTLIKKYSNTFDLVILFQTLFDCEGTIKSTVII